VKDPIDAAARFTEASCMTRIPLEEELGLTTNGSSAPSGVASAPRPQAIITREGERELRARLARLRHELDVEFASRLTEARAFGEIGNNDEYLQILEEAAVLASRVSRLERLLDSATVVDPAAIGGTAAIGTTTRVQDLDSGAVDEFRLIGDYESLEPHGVSASSPVGQALIGQAVGAEVEVELPHGRSRALRILSLRSSARD
jgi:transcription elongation factor GreA